MQTAIWDGKVEKPTLGAGTTGSTLRRAGMALAGLLLLSACDEATSDSSAGPPPAPQVTVAQPTVRQVQETDEYVGRFAAVEDVEVRSRVSGYLQDVRFTDGQLVQEGDLLFVIDQRPFQIAVDRAEAQVTDAQARIDLAEAEFQRAQKLVKQGNVSQSVFDAREQELHQAQASLELTQAELRQAELDLSFTEVRAPVTGRVGRHLISVGNYVSGGSAEATLLTTVVSLDPIYFYFDVSEADYLKYSRLGQNGQGRNGQSAGAAKPESAVDIALVDDKDFVHKGKLDFTDNRLDYNSGTLTGRAVVPNPDLTLLPGLFGRGKIAGSGVYTALLLPDTAIGTDQDRRFVLVVDAEDTVQVRPVALGPIIDGLRVIREGVTQDDRVIVNGLMRARPGSKVTPVEAPPPVSS